MTETFRFQIHPQFRPLQKPQIDHTNARIYGVVAAMNVEATGHGLCCDHKALELLAALGNSHAKGVPGRFGHPGISENATGRKVQMATNWRVVRKAAVIDGRQQEFSYLLHDAELIAAARTSPAFAQDPVEYILQIAESHPEQFAESMVLRAMLVWTTADGKEVPVYETDGTDDGEVRRNERPNNALTAVPVLRPFELVAVDFVNEGALTHTGLFPMSEGHQSGVNIFTQQAGASFYVQQLFETVDELRQRFQIPLEVLPQKVERLLRLYSDSRGRGDYWRDRGDYLRGSPRVNQLTSGAFSVGAVPSAARTPILRKGTNMSRRTRRQQQRQVQAGAGQEQAFSAESEGGDSALLSQEADETLEHSTAILRQAEQLAQLMTQSGVAMQEGPGLASSEQVSHIQEQLDQNTDQIHELTSQLKRLSELLVRNMELTAILQRNITRTNGEPVITQRVTAGGLNPLENGFQFAHPQPGAAWGLTPVAGIDERRQKLAVDEDSPEGRAIRAQQRRAQAAK